MSEKTEKAFENIVNIFENIYEIATSLDVDLWREKFPNRDHRELANATITAAIELEERVEKGGRYWDGDWYDACDLIAIALQEGTEPNWDKIMEYAPKLEESDTLRTAGE